MNTAVMQRATPKTPALIADIGQVAAAIGHIPQIPAASVAAEIVRFTQDSNKALQQAERAIIGDEESAGRAADLLKSITSAISTQEVARKAHTAPLDTFKAKLVKFYGLALENLTAAKGILKDKTLVYAQAERDRLQAEANARRLEAEEEAERLAAAQAALGDAEGAQQILDEAAARPAEVVRVAATGAYGASLGLRKQKVGRVTDNMAFLKFLVGFASEPAYAKFITDLRFPQSALNDLARAVLDEDLEKAVAQPDGFVAEQIESTSSR